MVGVRGFEPPAPASRRHRAPLCQHGFSRFWRVLTGVGTRAGARWRDHFSNTVSEPGAGRSSSPYCPADLVDDLAAAAWSQTQAARPNSLKPVHRQDSGRMPVKAATFPGAHQFGIRSGLHASPRSEMSCGDPKPRLSGWIISNPNLHLVLQTA